MLALPPALAVPPVAHHRWVSVTHSSLDQVCIAAETIRLFQHIGKWLQMPQSAVPEEDAAEEAAAAALPPFITLGLYEQGTRKLLCGGAASHEAVNADGRHSRWQSMLVAEGCAREWWW